MIEKGPLRLDFGAKYCDCHRERTQTVGAMMPGIGHESHGAGIPTPGE